MGPFRFPISLRARGRSAALNFLRPHAFPPALACGRRRFLSRGPVTSFRLCLSGRFLPLGNSWEQLPFELFDRRVMRRIDDVRVDVERPLDARVPELRLRD